MGDAAATGFSSSEPPLAAARLLGRRLLLKLVARGGMGDVYLAATTGIEGAERPCIVKTVRRDHIHDGSFLARFLDEARVQSQLQHPGVAQVLEAATDDERRALHRRRVRRGAHASPTCASAPSRRGVQHRAGPTPSPSRIEMAQALAHVHERPGARRLAPRHRPPRPVAAERDGRLRRRGQAHRLRHRARPQPALPHRRGRRLRQARLRRPRGRAPAGRRRAHRPLRPRHHALGALRGPALPQLATRSGTSTTRPPARSLVPRVSEACGAPPELDEVIAKLTTNEPDERYAARLAGGAATWRSVLSLAPSIEGGERGVRGAHRPADAHALAARAGARRAPSSRACCARPRRRCDDVARPARRPTAGPVSAAMAKRR